MLQKSKGIDRDVTWACRTHLTLFHFLKFQWFFKNRVFNFLKKIEKVPRGNVFKSIHANFHEDWSSGGSTNRGYLSAQFPTWDPCPPHKGGPKILNFRISNLQRVHNSLGILADWKKMHRATCRWIDRESLYCVLYQLIFPCTYLYLLLNKWKIDVQWMETILPFPVLLLNLHKIKYLQNA